MSNGRVAYLNARLIDPATGLDVMGALLTEDERIVDFGPQLFRGGAPSVGKSIDCKGLCLAPGLIDMRVQICEPGEEHKETIESAGRAALAGGVTAMVALPGTTPPIDDVSVLEFVARRAREKALAKVYCYGAITKNLEGREMTEFGLMLEAGAVAFADAGHCVADAVVLKRALEYGGVFGALLVQHPEEPTLARGGLATLGELAARLGLAGIPPQAEVIQIERDLRLLEMAGGRLHFSRVTTLDGLAAIRAAKRRGLKVTCDTAPHYFALNETAIGDYRTFAKVSPPLRGETDRQALIEGIIDGTVDAIASDHAPQDQDSKRLPFNSAAFGVIGVETLLPLVLELVHNGHLSMTEALAKVTIRPAELLRLPGGRLKKGAPADLVLFDPDIPWVIQEDALLSKSKNSAFGGRPVQGKARMTVVDGRILFREGV